MDLAAFDVLVPIVQRGVAEDVLLLLGVFRRDIGVAGVRGAFRPYGGKLALPRGVSGLALGSLTVGSGSSLEFARSLARNRGGFALAVGLPIAIADKGDPIMVDRA